MWHGTSNIKKLVFFKKQFYFAVLFCKTIIIDYLGKEVQEKPAGDKDVNTVDKDSTSYSVDGRIQLNKNRKYCLFHSVYDINY